MGVNDLIKKILELKKNAQIVIIARDDNEKKELREKFGDKIIIPDRAVDGPSLIAFCDLVISGSGTMNREAVVLGIPTVSTYPHALLGVDQWFVDNDHMIHDIDEELKGIDPFKKLKPYKKNNNGIKCLMKVIEKHLQQ